MIQPGINAVTMDRPTPCDIWHRRLGDYHLEGIRRMINTKAVQGLRPLRISDRPWVTCFEQKQSYSKIPKTSTTRALTPVQLVYTDLCGSFCTTSVGGARYYMNFIDDYSHKTFVYFLTRKNEALEKFKSFCAKVKLKHLTKSRRFDCITTVNLF